MCSKGICVVSLGEIPGHCSLDARSALTFGATIIVE